MPTIDGKSYPRLENGRIVYAPPGMPPEKARAVVEPEPIPDTLNLNTANLEQLREIRGVGPKTARDIIEAREAHLFASLADCAERVGGVSLAQLQAAKAGV